MNRQHTNAKQTRAPNPTRGKPDKLTARVQKTVMLHDGKNKRLIAVLQSNISKHYTVHTDIYHIWPRGHDILIQHNFTILSLHQRLNTEEVKSRFYIPPKISKFPSNQLYLKTFQLLFYDVKSWTKCSSRHLVTSTLYLVVSTCHLVVSTRRIVVSTCYLVVSTCHLVVPTPRIVLSTCHLVVSTCHFVVPTRHIVVSTCHLMISSSQLAVSSSQLVISSSQLAVSSSQLVTSSSQLAVSSSQLVISSSQLVISSSQLAVSSASSKIRNGERGTGNEISLKWGISKRANL